GNRAVRVAQQSGGALEPPGEQIGVRRLAERAAELAAEVGTRETGRAGQVVHAERVGVASIGEVLCTQQVAGGGNEGHARSIAAWGSVGLEGIEIRPASPLALGD